MLPAMQTEAFFSDIRRKLDDAQRCRRRNLADLFCILAPRLASARQLGRELDQHLARRFNVFDYLANDELGLSRIIADLLNPAASHGQDTLFLGEFLNLLRECSTLQPPGMRDQARVRVALEHTIENQRRIDILVEISGREPLWALAIENKPYAGDQKHQARDYLRHLRKEYKRNFLLIYLSPTGEGPSEHSIKRSKLRKHWRDNFAILPYHQHPVDAEPDDSGAEPDSPGNESDSSGAEPEDTGMHRLSFSLADWLQACRRHCEVERLRWFLGDAIQFCRTTFGGHAMTSKHESKTIRDFLFEHPEHFETALAVHDSWAAIRDEICKTFLERLAERIKADARLVDFADDLQVGCQYGGIPKFSNKLWLYRNQWRSYKNGTKSRGQRTAIYLESQGYGPNNWYMGVCSPLSKSNMENADRERREKIEKEMSEKFGSSKKSSWWSHWSYLNAKARNWNSIVRNLHSESKADQPGEITRHIVDEIVELAAAAIPIIDKFDR